MKIQLLIASILTCTAWAVQATQYVTSDTAQLNISNNENTRLVAEGGRILSIQVTNKELAVKQIELEKGNEAYIRPLVNKTITIFVNTETGRNYMLMLKPSNRPPESIVIKDTAADNQAQLQNMETQQELQALRKRSIARNTEPYVRSIKRFVYGMAEGGDNSELTCSVDGSEVPLWNGALFIRKRTCSDGELYGQEFDLVNTSNTKMVLEEQELYKKNVLAVAIEQHILMPQQATKVIVVTGGNK